MKTNTIKVDDVVVLKDGETGTVTEVGEYGVMVAVVEYDEEVYAFYGYDEVAEVVNN